MKGRAAHRGPAPQADTISDSDTAFANRRLLSPTEAATYLGLTSRFAIYRLVSNGKLPAVRLANKVRIDLHDLHRIIEGAKSEVPGTDVRRSKGPTRPRGVPHQLAPFRPRKNSVTGPVTAR
jgi:excisionase family DNA binding protein